MKKHGAHETRATSNNVSEKCDVPLVWKQVFCGTLHTLVKQLKQNLHKFQDIFKIIKRVCKNITNVCIIVLQMLLETSIIFKFITQWLNYWKYLQYIKCQHKWIRFTFS